MLGRVGQRSATETVAAIVGAFLEQRTWKQADLARRLEMTTPALRKRLEEIAGPLRLEREEDHPHVYWSVPPNWFPGALIIKREEVPELLRLLARLPRSKARERVLERIVERIPNAKAPDAVVSPEASPREQQHLGIIEDSTRSRTPLRFRYFTASRGSEGVRHASVHRVFPGPPARFVATCHRTGGLKWFRVDNVSDASLDAQQDYRLAKDDDVVAFVSESLDGFRDESSKAQTLTFFVRDPEARWVARNLPAGMKTEDAGGGILVTAHTAAISVVARFVTQLGDAAKPETPVLAQKVAEIASGALRGATPPR